MSTPYVGEIRQFAGDFAPTGWAICNGQLLSIEEYDTLYNLIGTIYGGDGESTYAVPDLQGRVPIHMGTDFEIGQQAGIESVTLNNNQIPSHTHVAAAAATGGSDNPSGGVWATSATGKPYASAPGNVQMNNQSIGPAGGSQPHENRVPFLAVTYIISLFGQYPSP